MLPPTPSPISSGGFALDAPGSACWQDTYKTSSRKIRSAPAQSRVPLGVFNCTAGREGSLASFGAITAAAVVVLSVVVVVEVFEAKVGKLLTIWSRYTIEVAERRRG